MNEEYKISVIVPLYNQERYLSTCLRSIVYQTYHNLEIIIVNDGSSDKSPEIAREWAEKDERIKIINKSNEGTSFARRDGYLASTGDFITFVDNDDLLSLYAIEELIKVIVKNEVDLVVGSVKRKLGIIEKNTGFGTFPVDIKVNQPQLFDKYYIGFYGSDCFPINIWGRLYRKAIIDKAYEETELFSSELPCMAGDEYFNLKLFPFIKSMYRIDKCVYYYRFGGTVNHFNRFFPEVFVLSDKRVALLDYYNYQPGYKPLFIEYVNCVYYHAQQLLEYKQTDKDGVIAFFKEELSTRKIVPRMKEYFAEHPMNENEGLQLLLERDYEAMYHYAYQLKKKRCGQLNYRVKKGLNYLLELKSKFFNSLFDR